MGQELGNGLAPSQDHLSTCLKAPARALLEWRATSKLAPSSGWRCEIGCSRGLPGHAPAPSRAAAGFLPRDRRRSVSRGSPVIAFQPLPFSLPFPRSALGSACHPWRRKWHPTPVLLPGESRGQRSLAGYSPWGCKELGMTEHTQAALFILSALYPPGGLPRWR